jgi:hypothetical protein
VLDGALNAHGDGLVAFVADDTADDTALLFLGLFGHETIP